MQVKNIRIGHCKVPGAPAGPCQLAPANFLIGLVGKKCISGPAPSDFTLKNSRAWKSCRSENVQVAIDIFLWAGSKEQTEHLQGRCKDQNLDHLMICREVCGWFAGIQNCLTGRFTGCLRTAAGRRLDKKHQQNMENIRCARSAKRRTQRARACTCVRVCACLRARAREC